MREKISYVQHNYYRYCHNTRDLNWEYRLHTCTCVDVIRNFKTLRLLLFMTVHVLHNIVISIQCRTVQIIEIRCPSLVHWVQLRQLYMQVLNSSTAKLLFFISPELKAQVYFSDHSLFGVSLFVLVCLSVNFLHFQLFSRTTGPISDKFGTKHPQVNMI